MPSLPHWLLVWSLGQNPASPPAPPPAPAAKAPQPAAAPAGEPKPAEPPKETDTEIDKFVKAQAAALDKIQHASAKLVHTMRYFDESVVTEGELLLGAGDLIRFETKLDAAGGKGRMLYMCDGKKTYYVVDTGGEPSGRTLELAPIRALIESKELADEPALANFMGMLFPYRRPGDMLRGLAAQISFSERAEETLAGAQVVKLVGQWRQSALATILPGANKQALNDLPPDAPTHVRLLLHKDTGWPVLLEIFHRDTRVGTVKPQVRLEFKDVKIGAVAPAGKFDFAKENIKPTALANQTEMLKANLQAQIERKKAMAAAAAAAKKDAAPVPAPKAAPVPAPVPPAEKQ